MKPVSQGDGLLTSSLLLPLCGKHQEDSIGSPGSVDDEACVPVCPISPLGNAPATPKSPPYQAAAQVTISIHVSDPTESQKKKKNRFYSVVFSVLYTGVCV